RHAGLVRGGAVRSDDLQRCAADHGRGHVLGRGCLEARDRDRIQALDPSDREAGAPAEPGEPESARGPRVRGGSALGGVLMRAPNALLRWLSCAALLFVAVPHAWAG